MILCRDRAFFDFFSTGHDTPNCVWRSFTSFRMTERRFRMTERRFSMVPYPHVAEKIESGELLVKRLLQQIHFASGAVEVQFEFSAVV